MATVNEDFLRQLADEPKAGEEGVDGGGSGVPPVSSISARARVLSRNRRIGRWVAAGGLCSVLALALLRVAGSGGVVTTKDGPPAAATIATGDPTAHRIPVLALADKAACGAWGPQAAVNAPVRSWARIGQAPPTLLYLPAEDVGGTPDSVTGGRIQCFPVSWLYQWALPDDTSSPRPGSGPTLSVQALQVGGPDSGQPCATGDGPNWPFGGSTSTVRARNTEVSVHIRPSGQPRLCARWTEPDGHAWYALTATPDTTRLVRWLDALVISSGKLDAARSNLPGLPLQDVAIGAYQPHPSGPARAFLETHGTAPGTGGGYSLVGLGDGSPLAPPASATRVAVSDRQGWWLASEHLLMWQDLGKHWWALKTQGNQDDAVRLAASLVAVPATDRRWAMYLTTADGYEGTPSPPPA